MKLIVISPEAEHASELAVLDAMFAAGLERYHVRKPAWSRAQLESWLRAVPIQWRSRLTLHQHHELVGEFGLGGVHWRDEVGRDVPAEPSRNGFAHNTHLFAHIESATAQPEASPYLTSRSCHDLATLRVALGHYDSVFFSPLYPSISKPGHAPRGDVSVKEISSLLAARSASDRRTSVLALGGITAERVAEVRALGFDGIAVIGAVWSASNPARAFAELQRGSGGRPDRHLKPMAVGTTAAN
jgi:thiamine-phosphate pyrophosphorylase